MAQKLFVSRQCRHRGLANVQVNWLPCHTIYMRTVYLHFLTTFYRCLALSGKKVYLSQNKLVTASIQADRLICHTVTALCRAIAFKSLQVMTANDDAFGDSMQYDRVLVVERLGNPQTYAVSKLSICALPLICIASSHKPLIH